MLYRGALGSLSFIDKKTGGPAKPESPALAISNLANIPLRGARKKGDAIAVACWSPGRMKKFKLKGQLVGFEDRRLLEIDSQERIQELAERLIGFCEK